MAAEEAAARPSWSPGARGLLSDSWGPAGLGLGRGPVRSRPAHGQVGHLLMRLNCFFTAAGQPAGLRLAGRATPRQLLHGFTAKATYGVCCGYPGR